MLRRIATVVAISFSALAFAGDVTCPIDNSSMYFTGETRVEMGKLLKKYRCPMGHTAWIVDN